MDYRVQYLIGAILGFIIGYLFYFWVFRDLIVGTLCSL